jgi:hypothetical protein
LPRRPSYIAKPDEDFSSPRTSSSSGSSEYFETMPQSTDNMYSHDFDSSRQIHSNPNPHLYQHVYLPPFPASDKNSHMGLMPTLPPPTIGGAQDGSYGIDSPYTDYPPQNSYSAIFPRMSLSRESSSLFDDWTVNSSISNIKLSPLNLNLPKEVESYDQNSS